MRTFLLLICCLSWAELLATEAAEAKSAALISVKPRIYHDENINPDDPLVKVVDKILWGKFRDKPSYIDELRQYLPVLKQIDGLMAVDFLANFKRGNKLPEEAKEYVDAMLKHERQFVLTGTSSAEVDAILALERVLLWSYFLETHNFKYIQLCLDTRNVLEWFIFGEIASKSAFYERMQCERLSRYIAHKTHFPAAADSALRSAVADDYASGLITRTLYEILVYNLARGAKDTPFSAKYIFESWLYAVSAAFFPGAENFSWVEVNDKIRAPDFNATDFAKRLPVEVPSLAAVYVAIRQDHPEFTALLQRIVNNETEWQAFNACVNYAAPQYIAALKKSLTNNHSAIKKLPGDL
jgi:hypothetical protein